MKKNKYLYIPLTIVVLLVSFFGFYKINELNYEKHNEIKESIVDHPENLPKKDVAKITSFWFNNLRADYYWLKTIQYIWWNAYHSEYKKYLYFILDLVTELNPYFEYPYIIGQLLLPAYEPRYESIDKEEQKIHIEEAVELWLKWVKNFCDPKKMELVDQEDDLTKLWNDSRYENSCLSYQVPFYLAYVYWFYKNDPTTSAKYYKIASTSKDSPDWTKVMAAIMPWKWWNREKSFFMFLNLANFMQDDDEACNSFANEIYNLWVWVFKEKSITLDWNLLKDVEKVRKEIIGDPVEDPLVRDTKCSNYVNKAIRELNLVYIEEANDRFFEETWKNSRAANELYDEWYLEYLPIDFQQYEDYGIIYKYNENYWNYDYEIGWY